MHHSQLRYSVPAMTTTARRCAGCGSPLPHTSDTARQIKCAFCGLVNDFEHAGGTPPPATIKIDVAGAAKAGQKVAWIVLAAIAVVAVSVIGGIYTATRPVMQVLTNIPTQVPQVERTPPRPPQKLAPADLAKGEPGWRELDVPAPKSGWSAFEPVTDIGWAMTIAHAWQQDARLNSIDADRLKDNGTIDLTGGPENSAGYRFTSPSQIEAWQRLADRDGKATVPYELMLKLSEQKVTALVVRGQPPSRELGLSEVDSHPLPELLVLAKKGKGFSEHPFYNAYMVFLEREGWVWYFNSLSGRDSLPRVRGRDGATYPYELDPPRRKRT
jgi:hypothetical protein